MNNCSNSSIHILPLFKHKFSIFRRNSRNIRVKKCKTVSIMRKNDV